MRILPWIMAFGGGIVFTVWLELQGLSQLLEPIRGPLTFYLGLRN